MKPAFGDPCVGPGKGMDHVVCPLGGLDPADLLIDVLLKRHQDRVKLHGQAFDDVDVVAQVPEHYMVGVVAEHKRFHQHDAAVALRPGHFQHIATVVLVFGQGDTLGRGVGIVMAVPQGVNADHETEDIGPVLKAVAVPSPLERPRRVAIDTLVDDVEVLLRAAGEQQIAREKDIALSQSVDAYLTPPGIGDTVADKEYRLIRRKFDSIRHLNLQKPK